MFLLEYGERNLWRAPKGAALSIDADSIPLTAFSDSVRQFLQ